MKLLRRRGRLAIGICAMAALLAACGGGFTPPSASPAADRNQARARHRSAGYVYVSNRTQRGDSELLVYPAGVDDARPLLTVAKGLGDAGGLTVDDSGNVYLANGGAGNVLEFAPGGTSLVRTYSLGLVDPVDVTVANGTLYVADRGGPSNGYLQQVTEYQLGRPRHPFSIGGIGNFPQLNESIAVNPVEEQGRFYVSATSWAAIPPRRCAAGGGSTVGENIQPTLWRTVSLAENRQPSGLAFDADGNMYVSDACANDVTIYAYDGGAWPYAGKLRGTFHAPLLLTIEGQMLAVPSAMGGRVAVIDLTEKRSRVTISSGLTHPVGAVVGPRM